MYPILAVGSWHLSTYYLLHVLATVAAGLLFFHLLFRDGAQGPMIRRLIVIIACGGLAGGYGIGFLLREFGVGSGVSSAWGALGGAAAAAIVASAGLGIPMLRLLDRGAPAAALWLGIGRIGCALAGCCYGRPTSGILAWDLPDIRGLTCGRYPTQLLSAAADFWIFGILVVLDRRRTGPASREGLSAAVFVSLYAVKRLILDSLRGDLQPALGPLTGSQVVAALFLVAALLVPVFSTRR